MREKLIGLSIVVCFSLAVFVPMPANAFASATVEAIKQVFTNLFKSGSGSAASTVTTTVRTVTMSAARTSAIKGQTARIAAVRATTTTTKGKIVIGGATVASIISVAAFAKGLGLKSSGSEDVDTLCYEDMAAADYADEKEYYMKVCPRADGEYYCVPISAIGCLDGSQPKVLEDPIDFSQVEFSAQG